MKCKITTCLYWYDRPMLFEVVFEDRRTGLGVMVDEVDHPTLRDRDGDPARVARCLVVSADAKRLGCVRSAATSLREAFRFPRDRTWFVMDETGDDEWMVCVETLDAPPLDMMSAPRTRLTHTPSIRRAWTRRRRMRHLRGVEKGISPGPFQAWRTTIWALNAAYRQRREPVEREKARAELKALTRGRQPGSATALRTRP